MSQLVHTTSFDEFVDFNKTYTSENFVIYSARSKVNHQPVILKTLRSDTPTSEQLEKLKHEYTLLHHLKGVQGVNQAYGLLSIPKITLVEEDIGAISLKEYLYTHNLSFEENLQIAIEIIKIIIELHSHHVIHNDINPSNIIINPQTGEIRIIDFSLASQLVEESQEEINPHFLEGTLAYIAPERTGRMNRPSDYRSDFYSLGVTFYEIFAKRLPFDSQDPLELIHDHIAKMADPISDIPKPLALVIAKLLAKNPDDRYVSAPGIKADLIKCQERRDFIPGENDSWDYFHISHKLYGRDEEIKDILQLYQDVSQGVCKFLLISGYSGIGKTSLVREVHKPMTQKKGFFISGKFDQLQRNIPYYGFGQAFQSLIHQLLSEPEDKLAIIRKEILQALGINAQIIIEVIPDLELIIGKQPALPELPPEQSQNRFIYTFQNFVYVFAKEGNPLIIFLDDLQWASNVSLKLLEMLLIDPRMHYLFVIGSYRDNEVNADHPLIISIDTIRKSNVSIHNIVLKPLHPKDVDQLIKDSFISNEFDAEKLTKIIHDKTRGNPFFTIEFIKHLYREHILFYNYPKRAWDLHEDKIESLAITDNVVDLMIKNIKNLPTTAQELLKLAACIGHTFDLQTLAVISEKTPNIIEDELWEPLQQGLIAGDNYKKIELSKTFQSLEIKDKITYRFLHDRIQQAAYELIPTETRQQKQLTIGRLLLKEWQNDPINSALPAIMNHFNECLSLISQEGEKLTLATLYQIVGKSAKASTAYHQALKYFNAGIELLDPPNWEMHYSLLFELYLQKAECEYLIGNLDIADKQLNQLLDRAQNKFDKTKVHHILISLYGTLGQFQLLTKLALENLAMFDIHLKAKPSKLRILLELAKIKWQLRNIKIEDLDKSLETMTDPEKLAASKMMSRITEVYMYDKGLYVLNALRQFRLFIASGYSSYSIMNIGLAAVIYLSLNNMEMTYKLANLVDKLNNKIQQDPESLLRYYFGLGTIFNHFRYPLIENTNYLDLAYKASLEIGDLNYGCYSRFMKAFTLYCAAIPLDEVLTELKLCNELCLKNKRNDLSKGGIKIMNTIEFLQIGVPKLSPNEIFRLVESRLSNRSDKTGIALNFGLSLELSFFLNTYADSIEIGKYFFKYSTNLINMYFTSNYFVYYAIGILDCYYYKPTLVKKEHWKHFKQIAKQIKFWAKNYPINFGHQDLLLNAEIARLHNRKDEAINYYDQAIQSAQKNNFVNFVAIINERAANYLLLLNKPKFAKFYFQEAYNYYLRWGARGKAKQLEQQSHQWLADTSTTPMTDSSLSKTENLDMLSISKATQAISEEIILDRLLTRIIKIVLENAAAQRVVILLGEPLRIVAEGTLEKTNAHLETEPKNDDLPISITAYVQRTKQAVVLHDASNQPENFQKEPYLSKNQIKSLLCAPISYQSKIMGVLYLENNLVPHAFTPDRLKVLSVLSSQAAISLENSRHFERMNQLYHSTERFVPKPFLELLHKENIEDIALGDGVEQDVTVLFSDLRNFTTLMQNQTSQDAFKIVNRYLKFVAPVIRKYKGFINQFLGDGILALFPHAAQDAFEAGIAILSALKEFNRQQRELGGLELEMGIGINTGPAMFGIIGEEERLDPAVISDVTNTAARVESLNKLYGTHLLITDHTFKALGSENYPLRRIDKVFLKGRDIPTQLYELIDWEEKLVDISLKEYLALFYDAFAQYEKGDFAAAKSQFIECLKYHPKDRVTEILIERCEHFSKEGTPKNWNGTFILTHK